MTESQSRIRALEDSANVSRRSEERPLISANELLRFPLDEVLVLPEGQYPIRARHVRYYEDRHFRPIDIARNGKPLPCSSSASTYTAPETFARMMSFVEEAAIDHAIVESTAAFATLALSAKENRKTSRIIDAK